MIGCDLHVNTRGSLGIYIWRRSARQRVRPNHLVKKWTLIKHTHTHKAESLWVPAHVGIPGNEKADALAKAATTREQIDAGYQRLSRMLKEPWAITSFNSGKPDGSLTHEANTTRL